MPPAVDGKGPGDCGTAADKTEDQCPTADVDPSTGSGVRKVPAFSRPRPAGSLETLHPHLTHRGGENLETSPQPPAPQASRTTDPKAPPSPVTRREPVQPLLTHHVAPSRVPDARPTLTTAAPSAGSNSPSPSPPRLACRHQVELPPPPHQLPPRPRQPRTRRPAPTSRPTPHASRPLRPASWSPAHWPAPRGRGPRCGGGAITGAGGARPDFIVSESP